MCNNIKPRSKEFILRNKRRKKTKRNLVCLSDEIIKNVPFLGCEFVSLLRLERMLTKTSFSCLPSYTKWQMSTVHSTSKIGTYSHSPQHSRGLNRLIKLWMCALCWCVVSSENLTHSPRAVFQSNFPIFCWRKIQATTIYMKTYFTLIRLSWCIRSFYVSWMIQLLMANKINKSFSYVLASVLYGRANGRKSTMNRRGKLNFNQF